MTRTMRVILMVGFAAGALVAMPGYRLCAQGGDPNAAPNPYNMQDNWLQLPAGRKIGQAIKVQVDHSDGKSIWVFDRCGSNACTSSTVAPIEKFDSSGMFQKTFGADKFAVPHEKTNPGFKQGIRIGSAKDGTVAAFIPQPSAEVGSPEGVGVDDAGNVYGGWVAKTAVRRFVKQ